jgi:hypothetical protein
MVVEVMPPAITRDLLAFSRQGSESLELVRHVSVHSLVRAVVVGPAWSRPMVLDAKR